MEKLIFKQKNNKKMYLYNKNMATETYENIDKNISTSDLFCLIEKRDSYIEKSFAGRKLYVSFIDQDSWSYWENIIAKHENRIAEDCPEPGQILENNFWDY